MPAFLNVLPPPMLTTGGLQSVPLPLVTRAPSRLGTSTVLSGFLQESAENVSTPPSAPLPTIFASKNTLTSAGRGAGSRGRACTPNYNLDDVTALLDILQQDEPLGFNMWAAVAVQYTSGRRKVSVCRAMLTLSNNNLIVS